MALKDVIVLTIGQANFIFIDAIKQPRVFKGASLPINCFGK